MYKNNTIKLAVPFRPIAKILLIMRLTTIILLATFMQLSAASFAQKVSLSEKNAPLGKVFKKITQQTGYGFFISGTLLKGSKPVTIEVKNADLKQVLVSILKNQNLTFSIDDKAVIIKGNEKLQSSVMVKQQADTIDISGSVVDENRLPVRGVNVRVKGTRLATTTDGNGNFKLSGLAEKSILQLSFVGYFPREINAKANLNGIRLDLATSKLDEVQVIAYGTTTKRLNTSSVGTISSTDIEKQPVNNILDAMIGRIAGLQITPTSGIQGAAPTVQIRGKNSISTAGTPLYILDGVPITQTQALNNSGALDFQGLNLLVDLNTADIESVSVLKDADATAIYGSRGSNGVILINTKRGKAGKLAVNLTASTGFQKVANFIDFLDIDQYLSMRKEAFANDKIVPTTVNAPDLLTWDQSRVHNWQKEFIGNTAVSNDFGLSFSGGNENTRYFMSTGYHKEGSVMPGNSRMIRKSFMSTISSTSNNKKFRVEATANYSMNTLNLLPSNLVGFINLAPHQPIYNADGSPSWATTTFPLSYTLQKYGAPTKNFSGNALLSYEFIPGLKLKLTSGVNSVVINVSQQKPFYSLDPASSPTSSELINQDINNNNWIIEPQLEYSRNVGKHHIAALMGATYQNTTSKSVLLTGRNFPNDNLISNIGSAGTVSAFSVYTPYAYNAFFGRVSYNFNEEWLANLTFRRDGSSRFGDGHKFGNFGAIGLGWIFSQREWIKEKLPFLSYGKIRGSYGITGNDQITDFVYLGTHRSGATYNGSSTLISSGIDNSEVRWETNKKLEAALELGFLKDRILFTGAYFRNRSDNQLLSNSVSSQTGFASYTVNFPGLVQNKGIEIELSTKNIQGNFNWNTSLTFSKSNNKLLKYDNLASSTYNRTLAVGQSLTLTQAYVLKGLDATGVPIFADLDGNGIINLDDRVFAGNKDPFYGGISNEFNYKGFSLSIFFRYDRIRKALSYVPPGVVGSFYTNYSTYVLDRWQNPGDEANTIVPRFTTRGATYSGGNYLNSDVLTQNRHIVRLSNAALAYKLPTALVSKLKMSRISVFANGQNLYVFDKHRKEELDPQTGNGSLPPLRTIVFGINASF